MGNLELLFIRFKKMCIAYFWGYTWGYLGLIAIIEVILQGLLSINYDGINYHFIGWSVWLLICLHFRDDELKSK